MRGFILKWNAEMDDRLEKESGYLFPEKRKAFP